MNAVIKLANAMLTGTPVELDYVREIFGIARRTSSHQAALTDIRDRNNAIDALEAGDIVGFLISVLDPRVCRFLTGSATYTVALPNLKWIIDVMGPEMASRAIVVDDIAGLNALLDHGMKPSVQCAGYPGTLLDLAAETGACNCLNSLLDHGADPEAMMYPITAKCFKLSSKKRDDHYFAAARAYILTHPKHAIRDARLINELGRARLFPDAKDVFSAAIVRRLPGIEPLAIHSDDSRIQAAITGRQFLEATALPEPDIQVRPRARNSSSL